LDKLEKEAVVSKEFKQSKEVQDVAIGLQGRCYIQTWQIEVFYPTEVAYRVFPPLNCRGFLPVNTQVFPPVTE
jgi:hypothetical protein